MATWYVTLPVYTHVSRLRENTYTLRPGGIYQLSEKVSKSTFTSRLTHKSFRTWVFLGNHFWFNSKQTRKYTKMRNIQTNKKAVHKQVETTNKFYLPSLKHNFTRQKKLDIKTTLLSTFQIMSSSFSPVHEVTLSIHAFLGLSLFLFPGKVPLMQPTGDKMATESTALIDKHREERSAQPASILASLTSSWPAITRQWIILHAFVTSRVRRLL